MAILRYGTTVIGIRGTIAGCVFSQGHAGPYVKTWRRPRNQLTAIAATTKRNLTQYGALWASMASALRDDWSAFAASPPELDYNSLGIQYWLTGYQWLVRANVRRESLGLAVTTDVPASVAVTAPATCTLTAVSGSPANIDISWTAGDLPAGHGALCYCAVYPTIGLQSFPGKGIQTWAQYEPAGTTKDISTLVNERFCNLSKDWSIFANLHCCRADGVRSLATPAIARVT
jgi:hypothetical protein